MVDTKAKAKAKQAIEAVEAIEAPDSGIPKGKTLEELVADRYVAVLTEPLSDHTGPNDRNDFTYIPEYIRDNLGNERQITKRVKVMGHVRVISMDGNYFYRWCHPAIFDRHRREGFDFVHYDELFEDATYFQRTNDSHIRNGDVYLMKIGVDGMARKLREKLELQKHYEAIAEGEMATAAEEYNTKAVRINPDGTSENIN
jgi:hypothetical protein